MGLLRTTFDWLVVIFLASHIPITMLVDSQAIFPREYYPEVATKMLDDFLKDFKDPLQLPPIPLWFKSFVGMEIALQLPFFFLGTYAFLAKKNWIRIPAIIYGSSVVTTMVPILAVLYSHTAPGYSAAAILPYYIPYLLVPLALMLFMAFNEKPFENAGSGGKKGKKSKAK